MQRERARASGGDVRALTAPQRPSAEIFRYLPQSPRALLLVDVDEVPHHAALDETPLSLHADLEGQTQTSDAHISTS